MTSVPDDVLENYTKEMMQKREYLDRMIDQVMDEKVMKKVKESVSLDKKSVTMEEFNKLFSEGQ
jgi:trigger factor